MSLMPNAVAKSPSILYAWRGLASFGYLQPGMQCSSIHKDAGYIAKGTPTPTAAIDGPLHQCSVFEWYDGQSGWLPGDKRWCWCGDGFDDAAFPTHSLSSETLALVAAVVVGFELDLG